MAETESLSEDIYKVALCGAKNVGKSSIFFRLRDGRFDPRMVEKKCFVARECLIPRTEDGKEFKIKLWDTLGLEEYAILSRSHYLNSHVILVVYSADTKDSLAEASAFLSVARGHAPGAKMVLVRNKIDLDPDEGYVNDGDQGLVGNDYHMNINISAKTGEGVNEMFLMIYQRFLRHATPLKKRPRSRNPSMVSSTENEQISDHASGKATYNVDEFNIAEEEQSKSQRNKCINC